MLVILLDSTSQPVLTNTGGYIYLWDDGDEIADGTIEDNASGAICTPASSPIDRE